MAKSTVRKHKHLQPVPDQPRRLADNSDGWYELEASTSKLIDRIVEGDQSHAVALVQLMTILTSEEFDAGDRRILAANAIRHAIIQTIEGEAAIESLLKRLTRGARERRAS